MTYTLPELERLLSMARQLGYTDDVAHWEAEITRMRNETT